MSATPVLTLQAATLYASGIDSTFTGTGGPFGFSPFTGQFGGVISSAGLASQPFNDTVYDVAAGDELTFVIAIQDMTPNVPVNNVTLHETMPAGFAVPAAGTGLIVTDGLGNDLPTSGDLFSTAGLAINTPLQGYDPNSGQNLALVTFSLDAGTTVPGPYAALQTTAVLTGFTTTTPGPTQSGASSATAPITAATTIVTAAPSPVVTPETDPTAVASGQTIAFDVSITLPAGTLQNFSISPVLPSGTASLQYVSSTVVSIGSALQTGTPVVSSAGSIAFGNVTLPAGATGGTTIVTRIVVRAEGTVSGPASLQILVAAGNASTGTGYWSTDVSSSVGVIAPPPPPSLSGLVAAQTTSTISPVDPFASLVVADSSSAPTATLAITLLDPTLGSLNPLSGGSVNSTGSTFTIAGSLATLQAAARQVQFAPTAIGTEHFTVTVIDSLGGVAQDTGTAVAITAPQAVPDPLFNAAYYLAQNPHGAAAGPNLLLLYVQSCCHDGRNPSAAFDTNDYLAANPDVKAAGTDPLLQYDQYGQAQGRAEFAVPASPPNPLVDSAAYYAANPDVRAAGADASTHYLAVGWKEGRNPDAFFETK